VFVNIIFPNDLSLGFSNSQLRTHLDSDRSSQIPCPLVELWWPDVARFDITKIRLYLEMVMSVFDDLSAD